MDQPPCKVAKPARGQLNREMKCPCRCIRGKYRYMYWYSTAVCIGLYTRYIFYLGTCTFRARFTAVVNAYIMCNYDYVCICMVTTYSKGKNHTDQPGKVANPARGQLAEQGKRIIPCPRSRLRIWSRETVSAVPSRVSVLISILQAKSGPCLRDSSEFHFGVHSLS